MKYVDSITLYSHEPMLVRLGQNPCDLELHSREMLFESWHTPILAPQLKRYCDNHQWIPDDTIELLRNIFD